MSSPIARRRLWALVALLVLLGLPNGCQKDKATAPATSEPGIRVSQFAADRTSIAPNDTTTIRAWVVQGASPGTPVEGALVDFSEFGLQPQGALSKTQSVTGASGVATAVYHAGASDSGSVTLKAMAGTSTKYAVIQVSPVPIQGTFLTFSTPQGVLSLAADSLSTLQVTVVAASGQSRTPVAGLVLTLCAGDKFLDQNHNGIFDSGDAVVPEGDRNGNGTWNAEGSVPAQVTTDSQGKASFAYHSGRTVGSVYVRATGGGVSSELTLFQHSTSLQLVLTPAVRDLLADGVSTCAVTVAAQDWQGTAVPGVLVKLVAGEPFTDTDGDGYYTLGHDHFTDSNLNGMWDALGSVTSVVTTGGDGTAQATYQSGLTPGLVTVRATSPGGAAASSFGTAVINLVTLPPTHGLAVGVTEHSLFADGVSQTDGSVLLLDLNGTPVAGKTVHLVAGEHFADNNRNGVFNSGVDQLLDDADGNGLWSAIGTIPATVVTGADGRASFVYRAGLSSAQVWIRAAVDSVSAETSLMLGELPSAYSINVSAAFDRITVSGGGGLDNTRVTATCYDALGLPTPAGELVTFSLVSGPGGGEHLDGAVGGEVQAHTDANGQATATLMAGTTPGLIQVGARSGTAVGWTGVNVGAGVAALVSCLADSVSLQENSRCTIWAYVYDEGHNSVRDGTVVLFTADQGLLIGDQPGGSSVTISGIARATFVAVPSENGNGAAQITAQTNGGVNGAVSCSTVVLMPGQPGVIARLALVSSTPEMAVKGTGGLEQTHLRAQGFDGSNRAVGGGRPVTFRITHGPGGGESFLGCDCDSAVGVTDAAGVADVVLASGTVSGTIEISVTPTGHSNVATYTGVGVAAGPPRYLVVAVDSCNVRACNRVGVRNRVNTLVSDLYHNPVRDGTDVWFTADHGMVEGDQGLAHAITSRGQAIGTWWSDGYCGVVEITGSTSGNTLSSNVSFLSSGLPYSCQFMTPDSVISLAADGASRRDFLLQVLDENGLYVQPSMPKIKATYGLAFGFMATSDGCNASLTEGTYRSATLTSDDSYSVPDDGIGAKDVVWAQAGFSPYGDQFVVLLRTGPAAVDRCTINNLPGLPPSEQTFFSVTIVDRWGNPLGGHVLALTCSGGTIDPTATTDSYGIAEGISYTAPVAEGTYSVRVVDTDPQYGGVILRQTVTVKTP